MTDKILEKLFELQDIEYKNFNKKLIPNVDENLIIGVRSPILRKFAKNFYKNNYDEAILFLNKLPHKYFEENNLHCFLIENFKQIDVALEYTEKFLPYIDNWATCDSFSPKIFKKYPKEIYEKILDWIKSDKPYVVRYGVGLLLSNYLNEYFDVSHLELVSDIRFDEYYVQMMIAWYFATAIAKQYDYAVKIFETKKLDTWTHNKAIQKCIESRKVTDEQKEYLRSLKIK